MSICADIRAYVCELDSLEIEFNLCTTHVHTTVYFCAKHTYMPHVKRSISPHVS